MHLLEDACVATVPGSAFGRYGEGYIRLAYSNSCVNIEEAMDRMEASLRRLPGPRELDGSHRIPGQGRHGRHRTDAGL